MYSKYSRNEGLGSTSECSRNGIVNHHSTELIENVHLANSYIEFGHVMYKTSYFILLQATSEKSELSCGWVFLKLFDEQGNAIPNKYVP